MGVLKVKTSTGPDVWTPVNGYDQAGADARYLNVSGDVATGLLVALGAYMASRQTTASDERGFRIENSAAGGIGLLTHDKTTMKLRNAQAASTLEISVSTSAMIKILTAAVERLRIEDAAVTAAVPIVLPADPTANLQAATKQYVDNAVTNLPADSVTNSELAPMATLTMKGNNTGGTAGPSDLTAAQIKALLAINEADIGMTINAQTGTTYTLVLADAGKLITLSNASAITLTVPLNSAVAFPIGTQIHLLQIAAGVVTVTQSGGVTVNATPSKVFRAQYSMATLIKYGTDTWVLVGDT